MNRVIILCIVLVLGGIVGCRTVPPGPAVSQSGTNEVAAVAPAPETRSYEQRAEADALFMAGLVYDFNDQQEESLDYLYKAAMEDLENENLSLEVSTQFILAKRYSKAIDLLTTSSAQPHASVRVFSRLGFVYLQNNKTNEAVQVYQDTMKKFPRAIAGYEAMFRLHLQAHRTNEAAKVVEQAAAIRDPGADFLVTLSEMSYAQYKMTGASNQVLKNITIKSLETALSQNPTNYFVLQKLSDGFNLAGDRKRAAAVLLKLQTLYPDIPLVRERLVDLFLKERDKKGAAEQLEALIRDDPTNPQAYYLLGILAFDDKRYKDAEECFSKTLLLKSDFEPVYYELAITRINLDQTKEALDLLQKAREQFKDTFLVEYVSAMAYMHMKDYTNAVRSLTSAEVIARAGEPARLTAIFYFQIGSACERCGRWTDGETYLKQCLKMSPDFAEGLNYLGYMYAEKGTNLVQAREMIEKALKQEPDSAAFLDSLAWVLFKQGENAEALKQIQRAIQLNKEPDATLYDHLGDILNALGEKGKAREAWTKSLGIEPSPDVRKKLDAPQP